MNGPILTSFKGNLPDLEKSLPCVHGATFDSRSLEHEPRCLQTTRVELLHELMTWSNSADGECIFWLSGIAGTGKSTIARTVADKLADENQLGASFFFSRGGGDLGNAGKVITTIAFQLAKVSSDLKCYIYDAVGKHPDIAKKGLREQWKRLVIQPISKLQAESVRSPLVFVVDALDECDGETDIELLLQLFAEAYTVGPIQLRVLVTSRPETPIRPSFRIMPRIRHRDIILNDIPRAIVDKDILTFFEEKLRVLRSWWDTLPSDWPGREIINLLVSRAHGLFIYASTVCRFLEQNGKQWPPEDLLHLVVPQNGTGHSSLWKASETVMTHESPTKDLDMIYTQILEHSLRDIRNEEDKQQIAGIFRHAVGTIVILFTPLSTAAIASLLDLKEQFVRARVQNLRSVLEVPDGREYPIRLLHPSFRDFLLDEKRCSDRQLWVDEKKAHTAMADSCIRLMSDKLRRDICSLHLPGALAEDVEDDQIERCLPPELQYACRYWVQHLQKSGLHLHDDGPVHMFLQEHWLYWLEALSLMRKISEAILATISLESAAVVRNLMTGYTKLILTNQGRSKPPSTRVHSRCKTIRPI